MHSRANMCIHTCTTDACIHITLSKATQDIAAGQELFYRYGGPQWFEDKKVPHTEVDYANTRWRPDLQPLLCRKNVIQTTGADGRHMYIVREAVPPGAILEVSLCLEVPVIVVDQFPYLWDFVLTRETENVLCWLTMDCLLRTRFLCCCRPGRSGHVRTR